MVEKKYIENIVNYILSNNIENLTDFDIYNNWSISSNIIIKNAEDVQFMIDIIQDYKIIKKSKLSKILTERGYGYGLL